MEARRVIFVLLVAVVVVLSMSQQVSARHLKDGDSKMEGAAHQLPAEQGQPDSYQSTQYNNLEEIDRLKLSINKLICGSMEEGCGHMDDAEDQSDTTDHSSESFANLNPKEYVREY
ncbi:unnamed protein product [Calypogeia fissa]